MATPPAERKALLFSAGGVRLALRLSQVREIVPAEPGAAEARLRAGTVPLLPVAVRLGLPPGPGGFALVIEATPPLALQADALHGIVDLTGAGDSVAAVLAAGAYYAYTQRSAAPTAPELQAPPPPPPPPQQACPGAPHMLPPRLLPLLPLLPPLLLVASAANCAASPAGTPAPASGLP